MNFSNALTFVKDAHKIQRDGWNGKGLWVYCQYPDANSKMGKPYLFITGPENISVPWLPSQADLFGEDWIVLPSAFV